jgi:hypothetical protein
MKKFKILSKLRRFIVNFLEMINDLYDFPDKENSNDWGF